MVDEDFDPLELLREANRKANNVNRLRTEYLQAARRQFEGQLLKCEEVCKFDEEIRNWNAVVGDGLRTVLNKGSIVETNDGYLFVVNNIDKDGVYGVKVRSKHFRSEFISLQYIREIRPLDSITDPKQYKLARNLVAKIRLEDL